MIKGGYYLKARCIQESEIAHCAPVTREVWDYLIREANHADNSRLGIKRGQCFRRIADIQEALHWYVGYRKMTYSYKQCEGAMKELRRLGMTVVTKGTRGMLITVCKYATYQDFKNYEGGNEGGNEGETKAKGSGNYKQYTNKEDNTEKKEALPIPDSISFSNFFASNGYRRDIAEKAYSIYSGANWHDTRGNKITDWQKKAKDIWFKPENLQPASTEIKYPTADEILKQRGQ